MKSNNSSATKHAVDIALCRICDGDFQVLLVNRQEDPYLNEVALIGGMVQFEEDEGLLSAAKRIVFEKTGLRFTEFKQLGTYGDNLSRDPRGIVISTAYYGFLSEEKWTKFDSKQLLENPNLSWQSLNKIKSMAFDHKSILKDLQKVVTLDILHGTAAFALVPKKFSWSQLRAVYETVLNKKLIAQNFPRDIKRDFEVVELEETVSIGRGKPARLIQFQRARKKF